MAQSRWRILAVDDNEDACDLIRMTLEENHDVLTLTNPLDTPDTIDVFEPDLIILDIMMPKVSGFQLMDYLKKHKKYKDIPVIFLSAKGAVKDQKYGYTLGASLYLTKPFQPSRLEKNVNLMLDNMRDYRISKKYSMREVQLRLSLQSSSNSSAGSGEADSGKAGTDASDSETS